MLPLKQQSDIFDASNALGGSSNWGIERIVSDSMHADSGILVEQLLPRVFLMLNKIMDATPGNRTSRDSLRRMGC